LIRQFLTKIHVKEKWKMHCFGGVTYGISFIIIISRVRAKQSELLQPKAWLLCSAHLGLFWREKPGRQENSYEAFYRENVPEELLGTHQHKPPLVISKSGIATKGIFQ
jgi:hypothetical protein